MRLLFRMCNLKEVAIIGGIAYKREPPFEPCIFNRRNNKWVYAKAPDPPGLYAVDGIGMGFTLIKTSVFKELKKPYFKIYKNGMKEDLNFCRDVRKLGHKILVDTSIQLGHLAQRVLVDHRFRETQLKGE